MIYLKRFKQNEPNRARSLPDHRAPDPKYEAYARATRRSRLPRPRFPTDTNNSVTPVMAEKPAAQCGGCAAPLPWATLGLSRSILMFETAETRDLCAACAMAYYYRTGGLGGGRSATSPFPFAAAAAPAAPAEKAAAAAATTKPNRCAACRRKVGLLGFPCRCGGTFCASHRHAETHGCGFDHGDQLGRKRIAGENPSVVGVPKDSGTRARLLKLEEQSEPCHEKACRASTVNQLAAAQATHIVGAINGILSGRAGTLASKARTQVLQLRDDPWDFSCRQGTSQELAEVGDAWRLRQAPLSWVTNRATVAEDDLEAMALAWLACFVRRMLRVVWPCGCAGAVPMEAAEKFNCGTYRNGSKGSRSQNVRTHGGNEEYFIPFSKGALEKRFASEKPTPNG
ncbi:hypothetical protein HU200_010099 [Digitaria exilis]|uniref:AN1-type domain-containing protein n=1 Tax=Digitaria exilis TaxID=1010633 RepID=A0A835KQ85_9POAL|nr:hypothetical protein HU200_010099 [Digitaria exilis]